MEISDPYLKYKFIVKKWENEFIKTNNRTPKKEDIRLAEQRVRHAYKMYWKMKTSLLEKTLIGGLDDTDDSTIDEKLFLNNLNDEIQGSNPSDSDPSVDQSKALVWGEHLKNKQKPEKKAIVKPLENIITVKCSKKLFEGCAFKKRNPRKSFVKKKTCDLDCSQNVPTIIASNDSSNMQEDSAFHDDSSLSTLVVDSDLSINNSIKISNTSKYVSQPLSILQKSSSSFEASPKMTTVNRKLDEGWLERCNENNSKVTSLNIVLPIPSKTKEIESDTDIIYESDNETQDIPLYSSQRIKAQEVNDSQRNIDIVVHFGSNNSSRISKKRFNPEEDVEECLKQPKVLKTHGHDSIQLSVKENRKQIMLETKVSSGKASENFVRLDLKRKIYSRGKRSVKTTTYKKKQWKNRKKELGEEYIATDRTLLKCFKCGDIGHYSKNCLKSCELIPLEDIGEDESPFLTLEEAEKLAFEKKELAHSKKSNWELKNQNYLFDLPPISEDAIKSKNVSPVYNLLENNTIIDTPNEVYETLKLFGHNNFRPGQEKAIMRILSGLSTLVTLSTGSGKSLCYQLPAYLYSKKSKCITLVVSPLISLMEDQVGGISAVNIACLHNNQTPKERDLIVEQLAKGELSILLLSPEAVVSGFNTEWISKLPPIAFACLDEAHCISQWSHNFRPSYLMICQVLRDKFGVKTFLGLTATATVSTVSSIANELMLDINSNSIIKDTPLPNNLILSVSRDKDRDKALINLLNGDRFKNCSSIIVYCIRRDECERIASFIRTAFQSHHANGKRGQLSQVAEPYHAGLTAAKRKRTQKHFMDGRLKIVVATVAFGMGINKSDLQGVIHYNMAKSLESYVQEIGRAGRDGNLAQCHMFLESEGNDIAELSRHIYSNSVDRASIRKLLEKVFIPCKCKEQECIKHEVAFELEDTISSLDMKQENIQTFLCYLELNTNKLVKNLPLSYIYCKITSYKGPLFLKQLSKTCPPLAVAFALRKNSGKPSNQLDFSIFQVASAIGWETGIVKKELKKLEWSNNDGKFKKSGVVVEFSCLGFRVLAPGNMNAEQLDSTLCNLYCISQQQETKALSELNNCFETFMSASTSTYSDCCDQVNLELCEKLKKSIREYFTIDTLSTLLQEQHDVEVVLKNADETKIISDVNRLLNSYVDCKFTARAIARIFHGIESPNFPAYVWGRSPFWRVHIKSNFNAISKVAQKQIISNLK